MVKARKTWTSRKSAALIRLQLLPSRRMLMFFTYPFPYFMARPSFAPDNFTIALVLTVITASIVPCSERLVPAFNSFTGLAVGLLFFLHGAKLSRESVIASLMHWRLHLLILCCTFLLFPLIGLLLKPLALRLVTPELYLGMLFLCVLPSTVQSSIAFTAIARGNVAGAVCSASASNLLGIFLTPLLVGLLFAGTGTNSAPLDSALTIIRQLLLPFIAGQFARKWIGHWIDAHKASLRMYDQGTILLVVYGAFSEAVNQGLWHQVSVASFAGLLLLDILLLGSILFLSRFLSRRMHFKPMDEVVIVFCGSKKSLASGIPLAKVLFAGHAIGMIVLPLMLFHQVQLMVCAVLAQRYAQRKEP